jgi:branched-chain amino acid transport system permease protein
VTARGRDRRSSLTSVFGTALLLALSLVLLLTLPLYLPVFWLRIATETLMWASIAISWNLIGGYTGYLNFGHAAFFGVGAYSTGILFVRLGLPFALALPLAGLIGGAVAVLLGLPTLRIRGAYFAIATWAFAEAMRQVALLAEGLTGGSEGLRFPPLADNTPFYYMMLGLCVASLVGLHVLLHRSKYGYWLVAVRENEDVAKAMGIDVFRAKLFVFAISGLIASLAGGIYGYWITIINPNEVFKILYSDNAVVMSMFGGLGTFWGPVIGAVLVHLSGRWIWLSLGSDVTYIIITGVAVCLVALFVPDGLLGLLERRRRRDSAYRSLEPKSELKPGDGK